MRRKRGAIKQRNARRTVFFLFGLALGQERVKVCKLLFSTHVIQPELVLAHPRELGVGHQVLCAVRFVWSIVGANRARRGRRAQEGRGIGGVAAVYVGDAVRRHDEGRWQTEAKNANRRS